MYRLGRGGRAAAMDAAGEPPQEAAMKRTTRQEQRRRLDGAARGLAEADLARVTGGDLYVQNPRGSSNAGSGGSGGSGG